MKYLDTLIALGLTDTEAKLYLAMLEIGPNPVSTIARKAGIGRTNCYAALEKMRADGLVSSVEEKGLLKYSAVAPKKLERHAQRLEQEAEENHRRIKQALPELRSLTGDLVLAPKVRYFEGEEGIMQIFADSLESLKELPKAKRNKLSYSSAPEVSHDLRCFLDKYIEDRKKHSITVKAIMPDKKASRAYKKDAKKNLAEVRIMPKTVKLKFESEISIYDDKIAIMSLKKDRLHGVIIESPEIAATERAIFELAWRGCR